MLRCFAVSQPGESDVPAPRRGLGQIHRKAVTHAPLLGLDLRQQSVRLREIAGLDRLLRPGFQGGHLGVVAGLRQRLRLQRLEALGDLHQLCGQTLGRNVGLAKNVQCGANLTLVQVQLGLQLRDQFLLCCRKLSMRPDEVFKLLGRKADRDGANTYSCAVADVSGDEPCGEVKPTRRSSGRGVLRWCPYFFAEEPTLISSTSNRPPCTSCMRAPIPSVTVILPRCVSTSVRRPISRPIDGAFSFSFATSTSAKSRTDT